MPILPLLIAIVCLVGAGLLMYPTIAAWFSQYEQSQRIDGYSDEMRDRGAGTREQELQEARDYNAALVGGGAAIAANERKPLADNRGAGVGHLQGTALPVGGASTHSVLTAHRGLASAELFTNLDKVEVDDTFTIEVFGEVLSYRVVSTQVVLPTDTETLLPQQDRDLVTLVTCTPLGINTHRILVTGERIVPTPVEDRENAGKRPDIPSFPWWAFIAGGIVLVAVVYVGLEGRPRRGPARR